MNCKIKQLRMGNIKHGWDEETADYLESVNWYSQSRKQFAST